MKTITPKDALKLLLFLLILCSAKGFSFTKLPDEASSIGNESKIGCVKKVTKIQKTVASTSSATSKHVMRSKNTASRSNFTPRVSL